MATLPGDWSTGGEPTVVKQILSKYLSTGARASVALVRSDGAYKAMLYVSDRRVNGPAEPQPLDVPKGDITHWMGNKPAVGLTAEEAQKIIWEVSEWTKRNEEK